MNLRSYTVKLAILGIAAVMMISGCSRGAKPTDVKPEETVTPVEVEQVTKGALKANETITGKAEANLDINVVPKASGKLVSLHVAKGDDVKKGQVLANLDSTDAELALKQAQAAVSQSQANLAQAQSARQTNIETAAAALKQAEIRLQDAKTNLERVKALFEAGAVSKEQYDQAVSAEQQAELDYNKAKVNSDNAQSTDNIKTLEAAVKQSQVSVEQARQRISDNVITSPTSGEVADITAHEGEMVSGQAPFIRIVSLDPVLVDVAVTAEQLALFKEGQQVKVNFPALNQDVEGKVRFISPSADENGKFMVETAIDNEKRLILPGMIAQIDVGRVQVDEAILVPTAAVIDKLGNQHIFVVKGDKVTEVPVEVVKSASDLTAIKGDVQPGDQVVVKGQLTLADGDKVKVVKGGE
jgi:multidrug efflux pump subunit AcrA (membrane-fusion protein)